MFIYELEKDEFVTVTVKMKDREKMEWKCPVMDVSQKGKYVLVPPLKYEEKILKFDVEGIIAEMVVIRQGKATIFRGCRIQLVKVGDQQYHAITTKELGVSLNRRSYYRVPVDEYCYVNHGKNTIDAFITDMSVAGFAFVVGHYDGDDMGFVQMTYTDRSLSTNVSVMGRVVRRVDREDGRTLFGCYMIPRPDIEKYLNARQRKFMKKLDDKSGQDN